MCVCGGVEWSRLGGRLVVVAATVMEGVVYFLHMNFRLLTHQPNQSSTPRRLLDRSAPTAPRPLGDSVATYLFEVVEPLPRPRPLGFRQLDVRYVNARVVVRKHRGRGTGVLVHLMRGRDGLVW